MYVSLVISGGAMKVTSVIGILKYLEEKDIVNHIKNYVGTSAGAIFCLLFSLGYTSKELREIILDIFKDPNVTNFEPEGILNIINTFGINNGEHIEDLFNRFIYKKYNRYNMTFIDFAKQSGKNLVICVSNLTKEKVEYFSVDTTPHFSVAKAIRASCSIPIMFTPLCIDKNMYLDGGLYNNFPIDYFSGHTLRDILGINIQTQGYQKQDNFVNYMQFVVYSMISKFHQKGINNKDSNIITLEFKDDEWFDLSEIKLKLTEKQLDLYIEQGYIAAKKIDNK